MKNKTALIDLCPQNVRSVMAGPNGLFVARLLPGSPGIDKKEFSNMLRVSNSRFFVNIS